LRVSSTELSPFAKQYTSFKELASDLFYFCSSKNQAELAALGHSFERCGSRNFFCVTATDKVDEDGMIVESLDVSGDIMAFKAIDGFDDESTDFCGVLDMQMQEDNDLEQQ
jgi:hypothetical protein